MTSANAAKGARWELAVVRYLAEVFGRDARRPHQEGFKDVGDIHLSPFAIQAKDVAALSLPAAIRDSEKQAGHADESYGVVVHKVRGKGPEDAVVSMSLRQFRDIVSALRDAEYNTWRLEQLDH
jgi:hypothetical protein